MKIRKLRKEEVSEVKRLCERVHWRYSLEDVERLYRLEPGGWFCSRVNEQFAGQTMGLGIGSPGCVGNHYIISIGRGRMEVRRALRRQNLLIFRVPEKEE